MKRTIILIYGVLSYTAFLVVFLYIIGFVANAFVPKSIDTGQKVAPGLAATINICLLLLFAIQHTIMARPAFKKLLCKIIPQPAERSTFVLMSSLALALILWQWRPIDGHLWKVDTNVLRIILYGIMCLGWVIVLLSSFLTDHFELFGLKQVYLNFTKQKCKPTPFKLHSLYRIVRHPLMLGFIIAFWATPDMTFGHLLFAVVITGYIIFGVTLEERELVEHHGKSYTQYQQSTSMLIPWPKRIK